MPLAGGLDPRRAERRLPDVAVVEVAVGKLALSGGEQQPVDSGMLPEMLGDGHGDHGWKRHLACLAALRQGNDGVATEELHLLADKNTVTDQVNVLDPQTEDLTLPEPAAGRYHWSGPPSLGMSVHHSGHLLDRPRDDLGRLNRRGSHGGGATGVARDEVVLDGGAQMADRLASMTRTYRGAQVSWRPRSHAWTVDGRIWRSSIVPRVGRM